jgi:vesicle transport through interaction with t-SNAREs protein 1
MSSSELFDVCEADFAQIYSDAKRKLRDQISKSSGEIQKQQIRELERCLEQANRLLQKMDNEQRKAPTTYRTQMGVKVRGYRKDVEQLVAESKQLQSGGSALGGRGNTGFDDQDESQRLESSQRARLLQGTASLTRASDSIARSHAISAETDQIGADILDDLGTQRESLVRTRNRLGETNQNLSKSRKILNTMTRRVMTNKLILACIILCQLGILAGVVYWKFFSK